MNWHVSAGGTLETPGTIETAPATRTQTAVSDVQDDWLCGWCLKPVANDMDRFRYDGQHEFTFRNPEGIRFEIMTFSRTLGCEQVGKPTLEHTWFPGHAWSFCRCDNCGLHLGWYYAGQHHFVGLIKDRLKRAALIRN